MTSSLYQEEVVNQDQNQPLEEDANRDHLAGAGPRRWTRDKVDRF